jgi:hypothetical protein
MLHSEYRGGCQRSDRRQTKFEVGSNAAGLLVNIP